MSITDVEYRINREIRADKVRLIAEDNENVGVVSFKEAIQMAEDAHLDLVEVAPNANPPVCRIMDFGKFLYERKRKERKAKRNQQKIEIKEIQIRPKTDDHHLGFKIRNARRWLEEGKKVRVRIRFRGREFAHTDIGRDRLDSIKAELSDVGVVEQMPNMEGRDMMMILAPLADNKKK